MKSHIFGVGYFENKQRGNKFPVMHGFSVRMEK